MNMVLWASLICIGTAVALLTDSIILVIAMLVQAVLFHAIYAMEEKP